MSGPPPAARPGPGRRRTPSPSRSARRGPRTRGPGAFSRTGPESLPVVGLAVGDHEGGEHTGCSWDPGRRLPNPWVSASPPRPVATRRRAGLGGSGQFILVDRSSRSTGSSCGWPRPPGGSHYAACGSDRRFCARVVHDPLPSAAPGSRRASWRAGNGVRIPRCGLSSSRTRSLKMAGSYPAVLVADERVGVGADLDELLRVAASREHPGAARCGPAEGNLGDSAGTLPVGGQRKRPWSMSMDVDLVLGPAGRDRAAFQVGYCRPVDSVLWMYPRPTDQMQRDGGVPRPCQNGQKTAVALRPVRVVMRSAGARRCRKLGNTFFRWNSTVETVMNSREAISARARPANGAVHAGVDEPLVRRAKVRARFNATPAAAEPFPEQQAGVRQVHATGTWLSSRLIPGTGPRRAGPRSSGPGSGARSPRPQGMPAACARSAIRVSAATAVSWWPVRQVHEEDTSASSGDPDLLVTLPANPPCDGPGHTRRLVHVADGVRRPVPAWCSSAVLGDALGQSPGASGGHQQRRDAHPGGEAAPARGRRGSRRP